MLSPLGHITLQLSSLLGPRLAQGGFVLPEVAKKMKLSLVTRIGEQEVLVMLLDVPLLLLLGSSYNNPAEHSPGHLSSQQQGKLRQEDHTFGVLGHLVTS